MYQGPVPGRVREPGPAAGPGSRGGEPAALPVHPGGRQGPPQQDPALPHALPHGLLRYHAAGPHHEQIQQGKAPIALFIQSFNFFRIRKEQEL